MAKKVKPETDVVTEVITPEVQTLVHETDVVTIIGNDNWIGQSGVEHVVSGNVANAIISKGWATLK